MLEEDKCRFEIVGEWSVSRYLSFQMLYAPLLGNEASELYHLFVSMAISKKKVKNHILLNQMTTMSLERMEKARKLLEMYLLVKTYYYTSKNMYVYQVFLPKEGNEFLRHELFGRIYLKKMGEQVYEFQKLNFASEFVDKKQCQDVSAPMQDLLQDTWDDEDEQKYQNVRDTDSYQNVDIAISFNYDRFLNGLSKLVFPLSQRTEKNLQLIGKLATVHGINEKDMVKYVSQSMINNQLDEKTLRKKAAMNTTKFKLEDKDPYTYPPVRFLQMKQYGVAVTPSDKKLIERLLVTYHLPIEVVNVLIEYVLEKTNQKFQRAYVEKIATEWVRLKIDTKEKAIAHCKEEDKPYAKQNQNVKQLPQWYYDQDSVKVDDSTFNEEELLEQMKKLRGE